MSEDYKSLEAQLSRIEQGLSSLAASTLAIADRFETLQQEFQRSATQLHRLGLNQESAKLAAQRQEKSLNDVAAALAAIEKALARPGD